MKGEKASEADLFPPIDPYRQGWLPVGGQHRIYWEESGNPQGQPVIFLHGGPGAGCSPLHRRFFDPRHYRVVLFDQRGAGRSVPSALLEDNDTPHLVADIEALRNHLGINRWLIFGGSWGSTLALAYGEAHPERCTGFVLRGIFLCRPAEVDWFVHGMRCFFPEAGRQFLDYLPKDQRSDPLNAYYRRLCDPDPQIHMPAAQIWCGYEEACSRLRPETSETHASPATLAMARIEAHYMVNRGFLDENQLLAQLPRLQGLPATIVQGRYDVICPITSAYDLAEAWSGVQYRIIPDAGHSATEPGIRTALVAATNRYRGLT